MYKATPQVENDNDRYNKILKFVTNNPKVTKANVIRYMDENGFSSVMTTHKILIELVKEGKIKILKDKPNSQIHNLVINEMNEFNKIHQVLTEIEILMSDMDWFVHDWAFGSKTDDESGHYQERDADIIYAYQDTTELRLRILLLRINDKIRSENDSKLLYNKLIKLMLLLDMQIFIRRVTGKYETDLLNYELNNVKTTLSEKEYTEGRPDYAKIGNRLIEDIELFKQDFLT